MTHKAVTVANAIIEAGRNRVQDLSHMKLQKLLFFAQGWHLAFFNEPLIEESFEAWRFGPVVPDLYHAFKHCKDQPVNTSTAPVGVADERMHEVIDEVYRVYGDFSAMELSDLTHQEGTPWNEVYAVGGETIPNTLIKGYFLSLGQQ